MLKHLLKKLSDIGSLENQLHWVKDVIFREDNQRVNHFQAATNFSTLKTIALNLFR